MRDTTTDAEEATPEALVEALERCDDDLGATLAVLWTWLERHLMTLGSLRRKAPQMRLDALALPELPKGRLVGPEQLDDVRSRPLTGAAMLLARIHHHLESVGAPQLNMVRSGFDGRSFVVGWRDPWVAVRLGGAGDTPPGALEHPALSALAPRLSVSPIEVSGIVLELVELGEETKRRIFAELDAARNGGELSVHLDTLGSDGLIEADTSDDVGSGPRANVAWFEDAAGSATEEHLIASVEAAVLAASRSGPSFLVLPELALTEGALRALQKTLAAVDERDEDGITSPVLTIAGIQHRRAEADDERAAGQVLVDSEELAGRVNEAVVLGPDGSLLWSHRKLTSAQLVDEVTDTTSTEDIRLGRQVHVLVTPIGNVCVIICLDAFAAHVRDRLVASSADVLLVPSLSPKVTRHKSALQDVVQRIWGAAFVCNRAWQPLNEGETVWNEDCNRSFLVAQRRSPRTPPKSESRPSFVERVDSADC